MQTIEKKTQTYEDYARLPEGAPYQLIDGALVSSPSPTPYHQKISMRLAHELFRYAEKDNHGMVLSAPIDVFLSDTETYQPDLIFIAEARHAIVGEKMIEGAPDFVVEILSPSTAYYDLKHKKRRYEAAGVKEYWIVDPMDKSIEIFTNTDAGFSMAGHAEGSETIASPLLEGFSVSLGAIF